MNVLCIKSRKLVFGKSMSLKADKWASKTHSMRAKIFYDLVGSCLTGFIYSANTYWDAAPCYPHAVCGGCSGEQDKGSAVR